MADLLAAAAPTSHAPGLSGQEDMLEEGQSSAQGHPGSEAGRPAGGEGEQSRLHGNRLGHKEDRKSKAGVEMGRRQAASLPALNAPGTDYGNKK